VAISGAASTGAIGSVVYGLDYSAQLSGVLSTPLSGSVSITGGKPLQVVTGSTTVVGLAKANTTVGIVGQAISSADGILVFGIDYAVGLAGNGVSAQSGLVEGLGSRTLVGQSILPRATIPLGKDRYGVLTGADQVSGSGTVIFGLDVLASLDGSEVASTQGSLGVDLVSTDLGVYYTIDVIDDVEYFTYFGEECIVSSGEIGAGTPLSGEALVASAGDVVQGQQLSGAETLGVAGQLPILSRTVESGQGTVAFTITSRLDGAALVTEQGSVSATRTVSGAHADLLSSETTPLLEVSLAGQPVAVDAGLITYTIGLVSESLNAFVETPTPTLDVLLTGASAVAAESQVTYFQTAPVNGELVALAIESTLPVHEVGATGVASVEVTGIFHPGSDAILSGDLSTHGIGDLRPGVAPYLIHQTLNPICNRPIALGGLRMVSFTGVDWVIVTQTKTKHIRVQDDNRQVL
jgi:hypothetical protein